MRCLTYSECDEWCSSRYFPTRHIEGYVVGPHPDIQSPPFQFVDFTPPTDSGRKVAFGRFLYSLLDSAPELVFWLGDWAVWPSSQHMPLFTRFRQAFGESRPLIAFASETDSSSLDALKQEVTELRQVVAELAKYIKNLETRLHSLERVVSQHDNPDQLVFPLDVVNGTWIDDLQMQQKVHR